MTTVSIPVKEGEGGARLDAFLASHMETYSRTAVRRLIDGGHVTLGGKAATASYKVKEGDAFTVETPDAYQPTMAPEDIPLDIVYEDADIVIVNKPAGMVVHPAKGHHSGTLVNALLHHCTDLSGIGGEQRPGIVHRLDKDTSGLIAIAKNDSAHASLSAQLQARTMGRAYHCVVRGVPKETTGTIEKPIGRHPVYRKKMSVRTQRGRDAITDYEVVEIFQKYAHLKVRLRTGRTHQIRVHLSAVGHPIVGDPVYGKEKTKLMKRPALHAAELELTHPTTGDKKSFSAPLPEDFLALLETLRKG